MVPAPVAASVVTAATATTTITTNATAISEKKAIEENRIEIIPEKSQENSDSLYQFISDDGSDDTYDIYSEE